MPDTNELDTSGFLNGLPRRVLAELIIDSLTRENHDVSILDAASIAENMAIANRSNDSDMTDNSGVRISVNLDAVLRGQGDPGELVVIAAALNRSIHGHLDELSSKIPDVLLSRAEKRRPSISLEVRNNALDFRQGLYEEWEEPIEVFKMMRGICFELGCDFARDLSENPPRGKDSLCEVLIVSQMRACQIADEILYLIEGGFADGAMARSRSLHEISVISAFVLRRGEQAARRYFEHKFVDLMKDVKQYEDVAQQRGDDLDESVYRDAVRRKYERAIQEFGKDFKRPYGWAAECLRKRNPSFYDIEQFVFADNARYFYRMASQCIHVGSRNLYSRPGLPLGEAVLLAGPSDIGFEAPGRLAAISLAMITTNLLELRDTSEGEASFEFTVAYNLIMNCLKSVIEAFGTRHDGRNGGSP